MAARLMPSITMRPWASSNMRNSAISSVVCGQVSSSILSSRKETSTVDTWHVTWCDQADARHSWDCICRHNGLAVENALRIIGQLVCYAPRPHLSRACATNHSNLLSILDVEAHVLEGQWGARVVAQAHLLKAARHTGYKGIIGEPTEILTNNAAQTPNLL